MLRKTLESNQIPEGTSRLAGGPYLHQGLSSFVGTVGIEPTWDLLTFQPRIRRRVYVPCLADQVGLEPTIFTLTECSL